MNAKKILIVLRIFMVLNKKMLYRFYSPFRFLFLGILALTQVLTAQVVGPPKPTPASAVKKTRSVEDPLPTNSPSSAPFGKTPLYDLEKCINLALQNNYKIKIEQANIEAKLGELIVAKATLYPTVDANARISGSNQDPFYATKSKEDSKLIGDWGTRIKITQSIFSGFSNRNRIAAAKLEHEAEYFQYQAVINQSLYDLKEQFYTILLRQIEMETSKETIKLLETELDRQKNLFEAGRSTKFSILRIQVNLSNEQSNLLRIEQDILISHAKLSDILGISWGVAPNTQPSFKINGELSIPAFTLDLPAALQLSKTRRPELQYFDKLAKAADHKAKAERASNIPFINLFSQVDERNNPTKPAFFDQQAEFQAGLEGQWNLFDGFLGKGRAIQQEANRDANIARKQDTLSQVESEVRVSYAQLNEARRIIDTQKENISRAEESVRLSQLNVETGYGTVLDVLQATIDLSRARNLETEARFNYLLAIARLEKSISLRFNNTLADNEHTH
ncbi:MAG: TolC family protein [Verrucomicrobiota bacterium]